MSVHEQLLVGDWAIALGQTEPEDRRVPDREELIRILS